MLTSDFEFNIRYFAIFARVLLTQVTFSRCVIRTWYLSVFFGGGETVRASLAKRKSELSYSSPKITHAMHICVHGGHTEGAFMYAASLSLLLREPTQLTIQRPSRCGAWPSHPRRSSSASPSTRRCGKDILSRGRDCAQRWQLIYSVWLIKISVSGSRAPSQPSFLSWPFRQPKTRSRKRRDGALTPEAEELFFLFLGADLSFVDAHDSTLFLQKYNRRSRRRGDAERLQRRKLQAFRLWFQCAPWRESESLSRFLPGCHMTSGHRITHSGRTRCDAAAPRVGCSGVSQDLEASPNMWNFYSSTWPVDNFNLVWVRAVCRGGEKDE